MSIEIEILVFLRQQAVGRLVVMSARSGLITRDARQAGCLARLSFPAATASAVAIGRQCV